MSRTEAAVLGLVAALEAKAQLVGAKIPAPTRNEDLLTRLKDDVAGVQTLLNVWDGAGEVSDETLGADLAGAVIDDDAEGAYEIEHRARIEWCVAGGDKDVREAAFDAGLCTIHDAVRPDVSSGAPVYLGGAVSFCAIERVERAGNLNTDGMPGVKACDITVVMSFTSPRPF